MEINFKNVTLYRNYNSQMENKELNNLNLSIQKGKISALVGDKEKSTIGKMICALEIPSIGKIEVGKYKIESKRYIKDVNNLRFEVGYLFPDPNDYLFNKSVKKEIEFGMKHYNYKLDKINNRPIDALKLVGLDETYYERNPLEMSLSEQKKVMLASILAFNPKVIIFDEFEKGLNEKDKKNIIRLIKMLKNKYNRTIVMISNDMNFLLNFVDYYFLIKNGTTSYNFTKEDLFNKGVEVHIELPAIVSFIKLAREKGSNLTNYFDINELIKGVYRDVK